MNHPIVCIDWFHICKTWPTTRSINIFSLVFHLRWAAWIMVIMWLNNCIDTIDEHSCNMLSVGSLFFLLLLLRCFFTHTHTQHISLYGQHRQESSVCVALFFFLDVRAVLSMAMYYTLIQTSFVHVNSIDCTT